MSDSSALIYQHFYSSTFFKNYDRYGNLHKSIDDRVDEIIKDPFSGTESLEHKQGKDLRGLRSARINRNFRVVFCVWEEYKNKTKKTLPLIPQSVQEKFPKNSVIFITVGPHEKAYRLQ